MPKELKKRNAPTSRATRSSQSQGQAASAVTPTTKDVEAAKRQLSGELSDLTDEEQPPLKKTKQTREAPANERDEASQPQAKDSARLGPKLPDEQRSSAALRVLDQLGQSMQSDAEKNVSANNKISQQADALHAGSAPDRSAQTADKTPTGNDQPAKELAKHDQAQVSPKKDSQGDDKEKGNTFNPANLASLLRVAAWCINADKNLSITPDVNLNSAFDGPTLARLRGVEVLNILGTGQNLALADPNALTLNSLGQVCKRGESKPAHFFAVGTVAYSSLFQGENARQLCVTFSDRTFPRMLAVLGAVFQEKVLYTPTFWNGVSLSTYQKSRKQAGAHSPGKGVVLKSPAKAPKVKKTLSELPAILPWNEDVLVFNGSESLKSKSIEKLAGINQELRKDSAVAVIFTVGSYDYKKVANSVPRDPLTTALSFNIQAAVLLARPPQTDVKAMAPSPAIGVDDEPELQLYEDYVEDGGLEDGGEGAAEGEREEHESDEGIEI